ncbi:hypothetical protein PG987_000689 [Apiospora arundinis]
MRHLALSGVFVALLGSTSAQQYGGGDGSGGNPTSAPNSGPGGSSGGPGGSGGSGISIPGFGGTCPIPEPTTVFVTVTQPAVVLPPPTTVTVGVPNSPFGYTSGVSAVPGPQWPSGAPDQTLTVPCITGPDGQPIPSEPGLITVTYPAPPGGSPGVGTYSLITVPPSSQSGYPGGPFGVSSSPGGSGGQGLSSNSGWGSFGWPPEATVTVTAPEGSPAGPWGSIASTSPEGYGGTYPFPEPTLTLSYNPPPGGNGGGDQGGSSYLPTVTVTAPEGPPGGEGGSPGTVTNPYALPTITVTEPEGPPGGQGGSTGTFTNPYVLPTITVTEPEGGSGGSSVPGNPGGQGGTYPFPEPTLTLTYHPPGGGSPGSYGGQGWTTVTEGSIGPSSPFPEITVTIPPNGQTSAIPGGPGGQGWSSTPGGGFGPSNPFPEITITAPPYGQGTAPPSGPSHSFPTITLTFSDTTLTFTYTDVPNKPQGTAPPGGQGWSSTSRGGFGPSNTLPEITITLPDTTLTVPYPVPNEPTPCNSQVTAPPGGNGGQGWSSTPGGGFGPSNTLPEITLTLPDTTLTIPYTVPNEPAPSGEGSAPPGGPGGPGGQGWSTPGGGFGPTNTLPRITLTLPDTTLTLPYTIPNEPGSSETSSIPQGGYGGALHTPTVIVSTVGATPGGGSPGSPGGSASQTFSGGYGWPSPSNGPGGQGQGSAPTILTFTLPDMGSAGPTIPWTPLGFGSATVSTPCPEEGSPTGSSTESTPSVITLWPPSGQGSTSTPCPEEEATDVGPVGATSTSTLTLPSTTSTLTLSSTSSVASSSTSSTTSSSTSGITSSSTSSVVSSSTSGTASASTSGTASAFTSSTASTSTSSVASSSTDTQVSGAGPVGATSTSSLTSVPTSGWNSTSSSTQATATNSSTVATSSQDYTMRAFQAPSLTIGSTLVKVPSPVSLLGLRDVPPVPSVNPYQLVRQYQQRATNTIDEHNKPAYFGVGPNQDPECFAFDLYAIRLGCSSVHAECIFTLKGLRFDGGSSANIEVAEQIVHVPACSSSNCNLHYVRITEFKSLTHVSIRLEAEEREDQLCWFDVASMNWSDNSREKAVCRAESAM